MNKSVSSTTAWHVRIKLLKNESSALNLAQNLSVKNRLNISAMRRLNSLYSSLIVRNNSFILQFTQSTVFRDASLNISMDQKPLSLDFLWISGKLGTALTLSLRWYFSTPSLLGGGGGGCIDPPHP